MKKGLLKLAGVHKDTYLQIKHNQARKVQNGTATTDHNGIFLEVIKPKVKDINYGFFKECELEFDITEKPKIKKIPTREVKLSHMRTLSNLSSKPVSETKEKTKYPNRPISGLKLSSDIGNIEMFREELAKSSNLNKTAGRNESTLETTLLIPTYFNNDSKNRKASMNFDAGTQFNKFSHI